MGINADSVALLRQRAAAFVTAQCGWLELGFRRDFFRSELEQRGCDVT